MTTLDRLEFLRDCGGPRADGAIQELVVCDAGRETVIGLSGAQCKLWLYQIARAMCEDADPAPGRLIVNLAAPNGAGGFALVDLTARRAMVWAVNLSLALMHAAPRAPR